MVAYFTTLETVSHKFTIYQGSMTKGAGNEVFSQSRTTSADISPGFNAGVCGV
jgi:hypothetical protein